MSQVSCVKDPGFPEKDYPEYFVFGQDFPWCNEESCVEMFRMESGKLAESTNPEHPIHDTMYDGDYSIDKPMTKYMELEEIFSNNIPDALLELPSGLLGTENEFTSYFYFEYKSGNYHRFWHIEQNFSTVPSEITPFLNTLANAVFAAQN